MRRQRRRKVAIDERLVALFRAAVPALAALRKRGCTAEECEAAHNTIYAFHKAADVMPWERSPLHEGCGDYQPLRDALLAEIERQDKSAEAAVCSDHGSGLAGASKSAGARIGGRGHQ